MRLLPRRKKRGGASVSLTKPTRSQECQTAKAEAIAAKGRLNEAQAQRPQVEDVAARLASIRRENHFAEMIRIAVMGDQP
jgi:hypothetical protein